MVANFILRLFYLNSDPTEAAMENDTNVAVINTKQPKYMYIML